MLFSPEKQKFEGVIIHFLGSKLGDKNCAQNYSDILGRASADSYTISI